ncbi:MAG TPA: hypothetical protein VMA95_11975 [Streptosporangiaceae bacterium]|nr:hypothetical protein [Streptosporangiaceae bacterium]
MSRQASAWRIIASVTLLAAAEVAWASLPLGGGLLRGLLLAGAICATVMSVLRLAMTAAGNDEGSPDLGIYDWPGARAWRWLKALPARLPWAELLAVAVLVLEALHPARPWYTVVLIFLLTAFLIGYHLAESGAGLSLLRPQLPLLLAGCGLAVLCAAAAALPGAGAGAGWLAVLAGLAAVIVAGLALPV